MEQAAEPNFIGTLGLNWKLFLAQLINFGIVILVLWKWVFRPVAGALEARRQKIEESVRKADEIERRLKAFEASRDEGFKKARTEAEEIMKTAIGAAESTKAEILAQARAQAEKILVDAKANIEQEKLKMFAELREEVANLTVMATEKILREKLNDQRDRKLVQEVLTRINK